MPAIGVSTDKVVDNSLHPGETKDSLKEDTPSTKGLFVLNSKFELLDAFSTLSVGVEKGELSNFCLVGGGIPISSSSPLALLEMRSNWCIMLGSTPPSSSLFLVNSAAFRLGRLVFEVLESSFLEYENIYPLAFLVLLPDNPPKSGLVRSSTSSSSGLGGTLGWGLGICLLLLDT